ncbi:MAG: iron ABC transporter substrate-binding protein, partial [Thermosphaera sp.]
MTGKPYVLILLMITLAFFAALSAVLLSWERFSTMSGVNEVGDKTESDYVTIVDSLGRTVKVEKYPKRVVAIGPGTLRLVVYLNATGLLAGVEEVELSWSPLGRDYAMAYGEYLKSLPVIGPGGPRSSP